MKIPHLLQRCSLAAMLSVSLIPSPAAHADEETYLISRPSLEEWKPPVSEEKVLPPMEVKSRQVVQKAGHKVTVEECVAPIEEAKVKVAEAEADSVDELSRGVIPEDYVEPTTLFVSATVYKQKEKHFSRIRLQCGKETIEAWSSINFLEMAGCTHFVARGVEYQIHLGHGLELNSSAAEAGCPVGAKVFDKKEAQFLPLGEVDKASKTYEAMQGLHAIYNQERETLAAAYAVRVANNKKSREWQKANPPQPKDTTIRFWKREPNKERK